MSILLIDVNFTDSNVNFTDSNVNFTDFEWGLAELALPELDGKTSKMYRGGKICLTVSAPHLPLESDRADNPHRIALNSE